MWDFKGEERIWRLGVRVPLVNVVANSPSNGPVEIIPRSVEMPIDEALERVSQGQLRIKRTPHAIGDVEVFNPRVVHRGSPNETEVPRYLLAFTFQPTAHILAHGAVGGGASAPSIAEEELIKLSPRAHRAVRLLPRL
jgi:ectoine hydroxylase-related dioxygenase (phytanoyl-CoA dioxygenase family)